VNAEHERVKMWRKLCDLFQLVSLKHMSCFRNGEFIKRGEAINNPDDTVIGYVCSKYNLAVSTISTGAP